MQEKVFKCKTLWDIGNVLKQNTIWDKTYNHNQDYSLKYICRYCPHELYHLVWLVGCVVDSLVHWFTAWLVDFLVDWLSSKSIGRLPALVFLLCCGCFTFCFLFFFFCIYISLFSCSITLALLCACVCASTEHGGACMCVCASWNTC